MNRLQPQPIETLIVRYLVHDRIFAGILREWDPRDRLCTRCRHCRAFYNAETDRNVCTRRVAPCDVFRTCFG